MPEIAEVARVVHYLNRYLVGKTIKSAYALEDNILFKGDIAGELAGRKVLSVNRRGKYFWLALDSKKCIVMHLGMTGWMHVRGIMTTPISWYKKLYTKNGDWPPKFWKFHMETQEPDPMGFAFVNSRRIGKAEVVDADAASVQSHLPLSKLGLDPIIDTISLSWLHDQLSKRRCPIKTLLLQQDVMCGIGNWVADEILYQARIHPQELCCDIDHATAARLHAVILSVCQLAVDKLADDTQFPDDWLFCHRWRRGKNGPGSLPNGEKLELVTVGGRTSCFAPVRQAINGREVKRDGTKITTKKMVKVKVDDENYSAKDSKAGAKVARKKRVLVKEEIEDKLVEQPEKKTRRVTRSQTKVKPDESVYFR
ncbi:hypothetical protein TD95_001404 [Thielaviopsis punctulata]|uniref:Formamidopyrimidine-DNA glycosylase catalytic domain-containing protein n=1 Tax=Thielaviopsis punctulata TaxID=72032 RepID=A0A0F4Z7B8_9PEZI|nr:hypothetical protein TD95_001404 [Thielaviopsis punctulata]